MKKLIKENYKYLLFLLIIGIAGGIFTGFYTLEITDPALLEEALAQIGGEAVFILVTTMQVIFYALIFGILGKVISGKIGLWREVKFTRDDVVKTSAVGFALGGVVMVLDVLLFSGGTEGGAVLKDSLLSALSLSSIVASFTYGGVVEELMMRLFLMSLIALIMWKLLWKKEEVMPTKALVVSNILVALLFAAGHLPATAVSIDLTPMIVLRCFLFNGGMGLIFGRVYRKLGIHYAMISHIFAHVGMKLLGLIIALTL